MKKVVPTLLLTLVMLCGKAQAPSIWFNELIPQPNGNNDEYIEFFNTSTVDIPLDCYIVVSYFKTKPGNEPAIYVYNFPANATIKALSHYIISSDSPIGFKSNDKDLTYTPDPGSFSNWNNIDAGGSLYKYIHSNNSWGTAQSVGNNFTDFMDVSNGNDATLFLYKINPDGTTSFVNGFVANAQGSSVSTLLASIESLGSLPINADASCLSNTTTATLSFTGLSTKSIDVITMTQAPGSGNGYAKRGDGYCGSWEKSTPGEFTPGTKNVFAAAPSGFTSTENYYCNNIVSFSIQAATQSYFPIKVELYEDNGTKPGAYDTEDDFIDTKEILSAGTVYYNIPVANNQQPLLLVYKSAMGCFNKVSVLTTATPSVNMTGQINCIPNTNNKKTVTYSITSVSTAAVFPLILKSSEDNGTSSNSNDDKEIMTHTITSLPFTYTAEIQNDLSNVVFSMQSSSLSCVTSSIQIPNACLALPVRFRSFTATRNLNEQVQLKWETANEQNNRGFNIQRKVSGEWKNIAFVTSKANMGNSNTALSYEYTDLNIFNGTTQYRLQQVDIDGQVIYSNVLTVLNSEQTGNVQIYPNPGINGKINILFKEQNVTKQLLVYDAAGRLVQQFPHVKDNKLTIEVLQRGFYTIRIIDRSTLITTVEKVIIQ